MVEFDKGKSDEPQPFPGEQPFPGQPQYGQTPTYGPPPTYEQPSQFGPPPGYGPPSGYGPPPGYGFPPGYGPGDSGAPFGRDPRTGEPLSDKSKIVAGLLQIFLGGFGVGRFYIGSNTIAIAQLVTLIVGWITVFFLVGFVILAVLGVWTLIDGILMLVGNVRDGQGRLLRN